MKADKYDPTKDEIVITFIEELKKSNSQNLKNVILFGSQARRSGNGQSDYDFLVVLTKKSHIINDTVYDAGYLILDTYEKMTTCIIWDEEEFRRKKNFSLGRNIIKEGIWVYG